MRPDRPSPGCSSRGKPLALAADPAGLVQDAVEEGLRWVSPIGTQTRRVLVETELGGVTLPVGANLGVLVSSANRDEEVWGPTADEYDLFRPRRNHAAFGFGSHFCSGHHFSRVQMRIAIQRLFERLPSLRADRPAARVQRLGVPGAAAPSCPLGRVMSISARDLADGELREAVEPRSCRSRRPYCFETVPHRMPARRWLEGRRSAALPRLLFSLSTAPCSRAGRPIRSWRSCRDGRLSPTSLRCTREPSPRRHP